jgi:hypothetical protein
LVIPSAVATPDSTRIRISQIEAGHQNQHQELAGRVVRRVARRRGSGIELKTFCG